MLTIRNLRKEFPGVIANDDVNLDVQAGETHAILGENGAGKSTLIKMISGLYQPDRGEILLSGVRQQFQTPRDAIRAGIGVVHQHFMLIPALTVAENVVLGSEPSHVRYDARRAEQAVTSISSEFGLPVPASARVSELPVGMQQRIEIVKALYRKARILILDEPTAVLTPQETQELFTVMRRLKQSSIPIIFISHKLDEVREIADTVTVMRAGKTVRSLPVAGASSAELARYMVGRDVEMNTRHPSPHVGEEVIRLTGVTVVDEQKVTRVRDVDLTVHAGEILGLAGIDGNGQIELVEAIAGLRKVHDGSITYLGENLTHAGILERVRKGIGYVPQDRQRDGLVLPFTLTENLMLRDIKEPFARRGWLRKKAARHAAAALLESYDVRPRNADARAGSLSGGNQQKVILAREVSRRPKLLIAVQPTRGLDVGAIEGIHRELIALREEGSAILLVSLELDEVLALSDRIVVMHAGQIVQEYPGDQATRQEIGLAMTGESRKEATRG